MNQLISKLKNQTAASQEMKEFLNLIEKSGQNNQLQLQRYIQTAGYRSVEDFRKRLHDKDMGEFFDGLIKIGLAILIAYALAKIFEK